MKISCEVIKDLLPLYYDDVCSNDSRVMIEQHLVHCKNCKTELQLIGASLPINNMEQNLKEADVVKTLSKKWKKGMFKSLLKGILITVVIIVIFVLVLYLFMDFQVIPKSY